MSIEGFVVFLAGLIVIVILTVILAYMRADLIAVRNEIKKLKQGTDVSNNIALEESKIIEESKQSQKLLTNENIYHKFVETYPKLLIDDYRPLSVESTGNKVGITIWLKNGDVIHYFPKN